MDTGKLTNEEKQLCAVIRSVVCGEPCPDYLDSEASHKAFFKLCVEQKLQSLAYMCIKNNPSFLALSKEGQTVWHKSFITSAAIQRKKDKIFTETFNAIPRDGNWFTVKGITLRQLYPVPELRPSGDEDIRVKDEGFDVFVARLLDLGFEVSFEDEHQSVLKNGALTLEVEKHFGNLPPLVTDASGYPSLSPTEHLVFLFRHAAEHFCHGGFGIRILADINIFSVHYQNDIDWKGFFKQTNDNKIFVLSLFSLCNEILGGRLPSFVLEKLDGFKTDTLPLLKDILASGIYGTSTKARMISGRVTSHASRSGILRMLFPSVSYMKKSYPSLNKCILILPFLYVHRLVSYSLKAIFVKDKNTENSGASLGMERLVLIKKYGLSGKRKKRS